MTAPLHRPRFVRRTIQWWQARLGPRLRVAVDFTHFSPGGGHGGIKPLAYALIRELAHIARFELLLLAPAALHGEIQSLGRNLRIITAAPHPTPDGPDLHALGVQCIYSPLGYSYWIDGTLPTICLIVDLLHRDHPEFLPAEDVALRERHYAHSREHITLWHCNSEFAREACMRHFGVPRERTFVALNAIQHRFRTPPSPRPPPPYERPHFLYPANFWRHKNHETLLVAYRLHERAFGAAAWPLVLTGHESEAAPRLRQLAQVLGLKQLHMPGFVPHDQLQLLWESAGALVFPSLYEGFGIPLVEAMWFGVPILAGRHAAIPEVAGDAAAYVEVRNPAALAEGLGRVATDTALRVRLIAAGRRRLTRLVWRDEVAKVSQALRTAAALGQPSAVSPPL